MPSTPYDIVLPVGGNDIDIAKRSLKYLAQYSQGRHIYIITPKVFFNHYQGIAKNIICVDENIVVPGVTKKDVDAFIQTIIPHSKRAGWYFQQFLKMGICTYPDILGHYLIWDADTLMLKPMTFLSDNNKVYFTRATEHHHPYFHTLKTLLNIDRQVDFSFISQHIMVQTNIMKAMINAIEENSINTGMWAWAILKAIDHKDMNYSGFSEYETYGNYVFKHHPHTARTRDVSWLRGGATMFGLKPNHLDCQRLAKKYDYVSFERGHQANRYVIACQKLRSLSRI